MPRRSAGSMLVAAATAACFALPDAAAAAPGGKASEKADSRATRQRGPDEDPAHGSRQRRASRRSLPAELQEGFEAWLREGLLAELERSFAEPAHDPLRPLEILGMGLALMGTRSAGPLSTLPGFSTTNLQEAGVDEFDRVKFDGEFLYIAPTASRGPRGPQDREPAVAIRVLRASDAPARVEEIGEIEIPGISAVSGLYLLGSAARGRVRLLVIGSAPPRSELETPWLKPWDWSRSRTLLHLFDVSDPLEARELWSAALEGELVATRRVEETLHLVTRASPVFRRPDSRADAEEALQRARERVLRARDDELLPRVAVDGRAPRPLVSLDRCLLGIADNHEIYRTPVLLTVTSLDLRNPRRHASLCMGALPQVIYSSTGSLYLAFASEGRSVVHKFAYTNRGPRYRGAGVVEGSVVGAQRGFSLGEHDGVLGVLTDLQTFVFGWPPFIGTRPPGPVTPVPPGTILLPPSPPGGIVVAPLPTPTNPPVPPIPIVPIPIPDPGEPELGRYRLTLLRESRREAFVLEEVSRLPNAEQPEPIGKPGDFVHGVRFMGERLYVVTFRKVDPLYAIDLEDPVNPRIVGQLEIPGFSDYLHPIGRDLLLGVGFDTLPDVRNDWFQGIKVELFDVSDPAALQSLDVITVGRRGSQSAALRDHHAISHLPAGPDGRHRFAVPIEVHDREPFPSDGPTTYFPWLHTALYLFEVEEAGSAAAARLREVGALIAAEPSDPAPTSGQSSFGDRSVIQGAAAHYVHGGRVWSAPWDAPEKAVGPE